jgi:hypothetical protein
MQLVVMVLGLKRVIPVSSAIVLSGADAHCRSSGYKESDDNFQARRDLSEHIGSSHQCLRGAASERNVSIEVSPVSVKVEAERSAPLLVERAGAILSYERHRTIRRSLGVHGQIGVLRKERPT